ncbi:IS607 family transposase [Bacillus sp. EB106-08-02-XG196]|uniref:IS607 family transposase n=1 Tax=Bacillus sp. EB106-08-02-XG196 TaxID=2737049 RepID=UPI00211AE0CB|nr:IS607 family transposase [Bacillus sp. EB106-08-02-XG196]
MGQSRKKIAIVRTLGGRRRIPLSEIERLQGNVKKTQRKVAIYARVSSNEQKQKGDLKRQISFLSENLPSDFLVVETLSDVGSGLNDHRKGLLKLMNLAKERIITDVAIRYKDRLTRFGYAYLEEYFKSHDVTIHVLDSEETTKSAQEELADDLISIITSFSGKLYGLRSKKHKELQKTAKETIVDVQNLSDENQEQSNRSQK